MEDHWNYETPSNSLIQTMKDGLSEMSWNKFLIILALSCVVTRIISGIRSRQRVSNPSEPQVSRLAPYWFPWFGHGFSFMWNYASLFESLRDSMNESVFGVYLRGETHNTVISPSMIKKILSSPNTSPNLALDQALQNVFGNRSLMQALQQNSNREISDDVPALLNQEPFLKDASAAITGLVKRNIPTLVSFSRSLVDQTPWERDSLVSLAEENQTICEASLFALIRNFVGHNMSTFLMGEAFLENFPMVIEDLWKLDTSFPSMFLGVSRATPSPGISSGYAARDRLVHITSVFYRAFCAWDDGIDPGLELRDLEDVSELFKQRMRTFRKLDLTPNGSAAGYLSLYWDLLEHISKITYWTVLHIFADSALLKEIRTEVGPYVKSTRLSREETGFPFDEPPRLSLDLERVLDSCPLFKACYYETIRLHSTGVSFRKFDSDMILSESVDDATEPRSYKMRKGEKIIMPHVAYQTDPRRFSNPEQYDPLRFIVIDPTSGGKKVHADILGPFAEGLYGSKDNQFNEQSILAFTAGILSMWEIMPTEGKDLKIPNNWPAWGSFQPSKEIRVNLKPTA